MSPDSNAKSDRLRVRSAHAMWSAGEFDACIAELHAVKQHTSDSIFLLARALLRINRIEEASRWLRSMEECHVDEDAIATHAMLLGVVYARLEHFQEANALFDRARSTHAHGTILAETVYYHALALWQARDYRTARAILKPALLVNQDIVSARLRQLIGFVATAEGRFAEAADHLNLALDLLSRCRKQDLHLQATLLHALSIIEAEVEPRDPARLDLLAHDLPWTSNLVMERVQTLRHIGLAYARTGRHDLAMARFLQAGRVEIRSPWSIIGFMEAVELCRAAQEPLAIAGFLGVALEIAERDVNWDDVQGEARLSLLQLAVGVARSGDGPRARQFLDLYYGSDRRGARMSAQNALSALNFDSRLRNFEHHAEAIVSGALGETDAPSALANVSDAWRKIHYRFRAAQARDDLRSLTHPSYTVGIRPECGDDGSDRFRDVAAPLETSAAVLKLKRVTLTPQQDRVMRHLIGGRAVAEIARQLVIEEKTVRSHLTKLYAMFDVSSQGQLIATVMRDENLRKRFTAA